MEIIDAGAEDIELNDDNFIITTSIENYGSMNSKLETMNVTPETVELQRIPNDTKELDLESALKIMKMIDAFEEDEDVQNVFHNLEITDELAAAL